MKLHPHIVLCNERIAELRASIAKAQEEIKIAEEKRREIFVVNEIEKYLKGPDIRVTIYWETLEELDALFKEKNTERLLTIFKDLQIGNIDGRLQQLPYH